MRAVPGLVESDTTDPRWEQLSIGTARPTATTSTSTTIYVQGVLPNTESTVKEVKFTICPKLSFTTSYSGGVPLIYTTGDRVQYPDMHSYFTSLFNITGAPLQGLAPECQVVTTALFEDAQARRPLQFPNELVTINADGSGSIITSKSGKFHFYV